MTDEQLMQDMMAVVRDKLREPALAFDPAVRFRELPGFDSIVAVQIVLGLETAFGIMLDEDDIETMHTLGDMRAILAAVLTVAA